MTEKKLNKILYVEDDPSVQAVVKIALINIGKFDIRACWNGKEALEQIDDYMPDLIFSDVMMPELDGIMMLKLLRKNPKYDDITLIFISARAQQHEIEEYIRLGAAAVFAKPFNPLTLSDDIREIWEEITAD